MLGGESGEVFPQQLCQMLGMGTFDEGEVISRHLHNLAASTLEQPKTAPARRGRSALLGLGWGRVLNSILTGRSNGLHYGSLRNPRVE